MNPLPRLNARLLQVVAVIVLCCGTMLMNASAQVPRTLNYQGYLTSPTGSAINNASLPITVKLYLAASGGVALYSETQNLAVSNGIFNMVIGSVTALNLPFDAPYYLGVTVGVDAEMSPRQPLTASPYALRAASSDTAALSAVGNTDTTIDSPGDVGLYNAITIGTDGFPVVSYYDSSNANLKVAKCINAACTGASIVTTVDNDAGNVGRYTSITIGTDGFPVISYVGVSNAIKVAKCINPACTGASTITTVATGTGLGPTSIAIGSDGFPVLSFMSGGSALFKKCIDAACAQPVPSANLTPAGGSNGSSLMPGANGLPVVASANFSSGTSLIPCLNATCTSTSGLSVDSGSTALYMSLAIGGDGGPIFIYLDNTIGVKAVKVAKCPDSTCNGTPAVTIATVGNYVSLLYESSTAIAIGTDGLPVVSFMIPDTAALMLVRCAASNCSAIASTATLVPSINPASVPASTRLHHSLTIGNDGFPVVSYYDFVGKNLQVIKCASVGCLAPSRRR